MESRSEILVSDALRLLCKVIAGLATICGCRYPRDTETMVIHYHGARALGLLRAIHSLVKSTLPREALVLNRSLLNLLIDLAWLTGGYAPARLHWFADCEVLTRRSQIDALLRMGDISEEQYEKDIEVLKPGWDAFCKKYGYYWSDKQPPSKWAKPIKELAYDLKEHPIWKFLWRDYESSYRYLSASEHTDPRAALHYLDKDSECSETREVTEEDYETLLVETCRYGIAVLSICDRYLSGKQDIDALKAVLGDLQDQVGSVNESV